MRQKNMRVPTNAFWLKASIPLTGHRKAQVCISY